MYHNELLKGSTETLLLALLSEKPMYGYQIVKVMDQRSSGYFHLKEGTLYPALHRLERNGRLQGRWEQSDNGQSRRYYYITLTGRARLGAMLEEWHRFTKAVNLVAEPDVS